MINAPRINAPSTSLLQEKQIPNPFSRSYTPTDVVSAIWQD